MKFCPQCGAETKEGASFCPQCAQPLTQTQEVEQQTPSKIEEKVVAPQEEAPVAAQNEAVVATSQEVKRSSKKGIVSLLIIVLLIGGGIFGGYKYAAVLASPNTFLDNFEQAVIDQDKGFMENTLSANDSTLSINNESLDQLFTYLDANPTDFSNEMKALRTKADELENPEASIAAFSSFSEGHVFSLKKTGKKWYFFDKYGLELKASYIQVHTNHKDMTISINGEEVATANKDDFTKEFGPFMPGDYEVKAEWVTDYVTLTNSSQISLPNGDKDFIDVDVTVSGHYVSLFSNYEDATLYVNGENTGIQIRDSQEFGPLPTDGSVVLTAVKRFPWGEVSSEDIEVTRDQVDVYVEIEPLSYELKEDLMKATNAFLISWSEAYANEDASHFRNTTERLRNIFKEDIIEMVGNDRHYKGRAVKTIYDVDTVTLQSSNDVYEGSVELKAKFNEVFYNGTNDGVEPEEESYNLKYQLIYNEEKNEWQVDSGESLNDFSPSVTTEFDLW